MANVLITGTVEAGATTNRYRAHFGGRAPDIATLGSTAATAGATALATLTSANVILANTAIGNFQSAVASDLTLQVNTTNITTASQLHALLNEIVRMVRGTNWLAQ